MEHPKGEVIKKFLKLLTHYKPIAESQFATLGGEGFEATIWAEEEVPPEHGWLIERSYAQNSKLISRHQYRIHNQLKTFPQILAGHGEDRAYIDSFHLDLRGVLGKKSICEFSPVLPLVLKSSGKCLAITVADQRRNHTLDHWHLFMHRGKKLLGRDYARTLYQRILEQQKEIPVRDDLPKFMKPFNPEKAAKREFGLLIELTELFALHHTIPDYIERYVYVSRSGARPFRMRTYFFHLRAVEDKLSMSSLADIWIKSKLFFSNHETFQNVLGGSCGTIERKPTKGEIFVETRLGRMAELLGGAELEEYQQLKRDSQRLQMFLSAIGQLGTPIPVAANEQTNGTLTPPVLNRKKKRNHKDWADFSDAEKIEWQLSTLEERVRLGGNWSSGTWQEILKRDFGHYSADLGRSLRAALARPLGGFRKHFEARIKKVFGADAKPYLDRLAKL